MTLGHVQPESISAVTLIVADMQRSVGFYEGFGFEPRYGDENAAFTSFSVGGGYLNLARGEPPVEHGWGRVIIYVADVDAHYEAAVSRGHDVEAPPRDAEWGERYFHVNDPDGHQISFARPL